MSTPLATPAAPAAPAPVEPVAPVEPAAVTPVPPVTPAAPAAPEPSPWDNPETAKTEIERLRKENGAARTNAKAQAAEDAKNEYAQTIGKLLGLVKDDAQLDPAALTASLTTAQTDAKQARVELAVFRSAAAAGGDPAKLLDSSGFLKSLESVDPADNAAVQAAITAAVTASPWLGATPDAPRVPAPNPAQGAGAAASLGFDALIAAAEKAGDIQTSIALKQARAAEAKK